MTEAVTTPEPVVPITRPRRDPAATRQRWVERLERFRAAGQTIAAFCAAEGISVPAFYSWKRLLGRTEHATAASPDLVPVRIHPAPAIEVILPSGALIRFGTDCDPQRMATVLRAVGAIPC
jgi:hypothetical protein